MRVKSEFDQLFGVNDKAKFMGISGGSIFPTAFPRRNQLRLFSNLLTKKHACVG